MIKKEEINRLIQNLGVKAQVKDINKQGGLLIIDFELLSGGMVSQLKKISTELTLFLKAQSQKCTISPIPSEGIVRFEILVGKQEVVTLSSFGIKSTLFMDKEIPIILGKDARGKPLVVDLTEMPHLLIAGATGSGKSMALHNFIINILINKDANVKLALVDPKRVEFFRYKRVKKIFNMASSVDESIELFSSLVVEMERRFKILEKKKCRNLIEYNEKKRKKIPYIVLVVDEMADLMVEAKKKIEPLISKLSQKSRACGIHLIMATQRPSTNVITGVIKANFPSRISFKVSSMVDSRIVFDTNGAEKLLGKGDGMISAPELPFVRFQGIFIPINELDNIIKENNKSILRWW
jgi:S-DNA-T family DNA segregation ATPase FtsK/SpoIIIE